MKQKVIEPVLGICLLAMVVMAVKYGSIRVTGSGDAYIKETPVVVVDAGHGGTDPGKVGVDGSLEKDINLAVAERLKTYLEQDDVKVIMTRETDTRLYSETDSRKKMADMKKRCEIIEESGADVVITDCETCKWQIEMSTSKRCEHPITLLAQALSAPA